MLKPSYPSVTLKGDDAILIIAVDDILADKDVLL